MQNNQSNLRDFRIDSSTEVEAPEAGSQVEEVQEEQELAVGQMMLLKPSTAPSWPPSSKSIAE